MKLLGEWSKSIDVDHETYANVCQDIFEHQFDNSTLTIHTKEFSQLSISVGPNKGIMFKNVELILKSRGMMK